MELPRDPPDADAGNVVSLAHVRAGRNHAGGGTPPPMASPTPDDRPAPPGARGNASHRTLALTLCSAVLHGAVLVAFARQPPPQASIGIEVVSVEMVVGADQLAGLAEQPGDSEASSAASAGEPLPEPQETAASEPDTTDIAKAETAPDATPEQALEPTPEEPRETAEQPPEFQEPVETAEAPAEPETRPEPQVAEAPAPDTEPEPVREATATTPEPDLPPPPEPAPVVLDEEAPERTASVPEQKPAPAETAVAETVQAETTPTERAEAVPPLPRAAPAARPEPSVAKPSVAKPPVSKPKPVVTKPRPKTRTAVRADRGPPQRTRSAASTASTAASGIGRGRSDLTTNYRGLVAAHLARHKRFPAEARAAGRSGSTSVTFSIDGAGRVVSVRLGRSSGIPSLDQETVAMVRRASPFPPPPGGQQVSFSVPVGFHLR
ncbi:Ferric siderophore transport system, periplasmic binding protein TonB [Rhodovulum sp. PH10]|nr:Ferric siderophore transport system, periplasmic binding protein TonB [Rhodovulum sp. PH10]